MVTSRKAKYIPFMSPLNINFVMKVQLFQIEKYPVGPPKNLTPGEPELLLIKKP